MYYCNSVKVSNSSKVNNQYWLLLGSRSDFIPCSTFCVTATINVLPPAISMPPPGVFTTGLPMPLTTEGVQTPASPTTLVIGSPANGPAATTVSPGSLSEQTTPNIAFSTHPVPTDPSPSAGTADTTLIAQTTASSTIPGGQTGASGIVSSGLESSSPFTSDGSSTLPINGVVTSTSATTAGGATASDATVGSSGATATTTAPSMIVTGLSGSNSVTAATHIQSTNTNQGTKSTLTTSAGDGGNLTPTMILVGETTTVPKGHTDASTVGSGTATTSTRLHEGGIGSGSTTNSPSSDGNSGGTDKVTTAGSKAGTISPVVTGSEQSISTGPTTISVGAGEQSPGDTGATSGASTGLTTPTGTSGVTTRASIGPTTPNGSSGSSADFGESTGGSHTPTFVTDTRPTINPSDVTSSDNVVGSTTLTGQSAGSGSVTPTITAPTSAVANLHNQSSTMSISATQTILVATSSESFSSQPSGSTGDTGQSTDTNLGEVTTKAGIEWYNELALYTVWPNVCYHQTVC